MHRTHTSFSADCIFPPQKPQRLQYSPKPPSTDNASDDASEKSALKANATDDAYSIGENMSLPKGAADISDEEKSIAENTACDPLVAQVWRLYTKAKDNLPNGVRLEN